MDASFDQGDEATTDINQPEQILQDAYDEVNVNIEMKKKFGKEMFERF
jgi:hypothetical protein